jgi:hypothetical protein
MRTACKNGRPPHPARATGAGSGRGPAQPRRDSTGSREDDMMDAPPPDQLPEPDGMDPAAPRMGSTSWAVAPCSRRSGTGGPPAPVLH